MHTVWKKVGRGCIASLMSLCLALAVTVTGWTSGVVQASAATAGGEPGLLGRTVVIDAGHGGPDSGARSVDGIYEKDITLGVAKKLGVLLQQAGGNVHYTRVIDDDLATDRDRALHRRQNRDLRGRVEVANKYQPDVFVSIHCNAVGSDQWHGAQTIYQVGNPEGEALAKCMQRYFRDNLLPTSRSADDMKSLYLLKRIPHATVIAEIGFLSHPAESRALATDAYQQKVAYAMYMAIMDYLGARASQNDSA